MAGKIVGLSKSKQEALDKLRREKAVKEALENTKPVEDLKEDSSGTLKPIKRQPGKVQKSEPSEETLQLDPCPRKLSRDLRHCLGRVRD